MAGHSKWSQIKRAKGKTDAQRAKVFTKIGREIAVAVKLGGVDPNLNSRLRDTIAKAKSQNMPNDNISRAIKKAGGEIGSINYENTVYEGYGVNGVAVIVECLTDNKNRTAQDIRLAFDKFGGSMGVSGCVSYLFRNCGLIVIERKEGTSEDEVLSILLDSGAEDFSASEDVFEVITDVSNFHEINSTLEKHNFTILSSSLTKLPSNYITVQDTVKFEKMLDMLDDNDDVKEVYHNGLFA
ncbi:MAG: YebC/PmpR family DNA-binding transcriptional regulator [Firmicutes bacterium]|nr:YebC/PmpR family DNA-binding transcriptional regulator [Bacillota bacterium]